jgi:predicted nucleic acid-binding protein
VSAAAPWTVVITDTSILINFIHTGHLSLLGRLQTFRFVVPDEVISEIVQADQRLVIEGAIAAGHLQCESISTPEELTCACPLG